MPPPAGGTAVALAAVAGGALHPPEGPGLRQGRPAKSLSHRAADAGIRRGGHRWCPPARARHPARLPRALAAHARGQGTQPLARGHLRCVQPPPAAACCIASCWTARRRCCRANGWRWLGVLLRLLERAYRARAEVALVCFGGGSAEVRLQPARARPWSDAWIRPIAGGGGTPLALGTERAGRLLAQRAPPSGAAALAVAAQRWPQQRAAGASALGGCGDGGGLRTAGGAAGACRRLAEDWEGSTVADRLIG